MEKLNQKQLDVLKGALEQLNNSETFPSNISPYLTSNDVADLMKVSKATINNFVAKGILSKHKIGKQVRYHKDDVEAALRKFEEKIGITDIDISDDPLKMTIQDAADYLRVTPSTIRSYIKKGLLQKHTIGNYIYLKKEEVEAAILRQENQPKVNTSITLADTSDCYSINDAARLLKISVPTLHLYANTGLITKHKLNDKTYVKKTEVENLQAKVDLLKSM